MQIRFNGLHEATCGHRVKKVDITKQIEQHPRAKGKAIFLSKLSLTQK